MKRIFLLILFSFCLTSIIGCTSLQSSSENNVKKNCLTKELADILIDNIDFEGVTIHTTIRYLQFEVNKKLPSDKRIVFVIQADIEHPMEIIRTMLESSSDTSCTDIKSIDDGANSGAARKKLWKKLEPAITIKADRPVTFGSLIQEIAKNYDFVYLQKDNSIIFYDPWIFEMINQQVEWPYKGELHNLIKDADKIVVRDGGDICCISPEETLKQKTLFEIVDPNEVKDIYKHIEFKPNAHINGCLCCGHPGIDWYKGDNRIAITAWKHGYGIMWDGGKVGDLTDDSKAWLKSWLLKHGLTEDQIK